MTLNGEIQALLGGLRTQVPAETFGKLQQVFDRLQAAHTGEGAPQAGDAAPQVSFTSAAGEDLPLSSLYRSKPLVLLFYRGRWCPFCDLTLRAYSAAADQFRTAGADLVAVSPQTLEETAKTVEERSLAFKVLRDPHNAAAQAFGIAWELTPEEQVLYAGFNSHVDKANGEEAWRLPAPAVFVIDRQGIVHWSWVDSNWTRRAEPADVLNAVRQLADSGLTERNDA